MPGDIKLATLSDTDTTTIDKPVTNGDFSGSDLSSSCSYNFKASNQPLQSKNGQLKLTHTGTAGYVFATVSIPQRLGAGSI